MIHLNVNQFRDLMQFVYIYSSSSYIDLQPHGKQVHIQQVGQRELRRVPRLAQKAAERKKKEELVLHKAGMKAHL